MTSYSVERKGNEITFWTNNEELANDVAKYIQNCIDAISWRSRVDQVKYIKEADNEHR